MTVLKSTDYTKYVFPTSETRNIHSFISVEHMILAGCRLNGTPARIVRFNDPLNDLSDYDILDMPDIPDYVEGFLTHYDNAESMVYDPVRKMVYVSFQSNGNNTVIVEIDPFASPMTYNEIVSNMVDVQGDAIICDDDYLYIAGYNEPAFVLKYSLNDRDEQGQLEQIAKTVLTDCANAHAIVKHGDYIYCTGASSPAWIAKLNANTMTVDAIAQMPAGYNIFTDDMAVAGNSIICGLENSGANTGAIVIFDADTLEYGIIRPETTGSCYGVFNSGEYLWAVHYQYPAVITKIDVLTGDTGTYEIQSIAEGFNEVIQIGNFLFLTTWTETGQPVTVAKIDTAKFEVKRMATFSETQLTTIAKLSKYEAEINNLSKAYTRKALSIAQTTQLVPIPDTITAITAIKSNNVQVSLVKGGGTWALPIGEYVRFVLDTTSNDYFSLLEGTGSVVTSANGGFTLTLGTPPTWTNVKLQSDWQPKIDTAKEMIYDRLFTAISGKTAASLIPEIIEGIANPEVLAIASDYKTLELIYMDLYGKVGTEETITAKLRYYSDQHEKAFERAFYALDFGKYGYIFNSEMGRISR